MIIDYYGIDLLIPYENNPRENEGAVDNVAKSIKEFGFKNPIIIDKENVIIAGHTRYLASKKLGYSEVPVIKAVDLTPEQVKAYRIADNKTGEFSEWDMDLLINELEELQMNDYNLEETGFEIDELEKMLGYEGLEDPEEEEKPLTDLSDEVKGSFEVIVECGNEIEQEEVFNKLQSEGLKCRVLTL